MLTYTYSSISTSLAARSQAQGGRRHRPVQQIRASYNVDVESQPKAPNSAPNFGGSPPPPPPPPPPPANNRVGNFRLPSGRDALVALLGAGIGVAGMWLYYEAGDAPYTDEQLDAILAQEAIQRALEGDADFLNALDTAITFTFPDELLDAAAEAAAEAVAAGQ